ncbi:MAG: hypothetical protein Q9163_003638 [Psora crenata]
MRNNTFLSNWASNCNPYTNFSQLECQAAVGGFFEQDKSWTWTAAANASVLGLPMDNSKPTGSLYGTDTLCLNSVCSLPGFPFGYTNDDVKQAALFGLGQNSSLLNDLYTAGAIPSRTWSLYHGWDGADSAHQADGSLILGGYDAAKTSGPNITLPFAANDDFGVGSCPSKQVVTVSDITMNLKNGSSPSILGRNNDASFRACLLPNRSDIALSSDIWRGFLQISGSVETGRSSSFLSAAQMLIAADGAYDGDLTFRLYPGLNITIPNHQLVKPEYDFDEQGQRYIRNESNRLVQIKSLDEDGDGSKDCTMASFGMGFFSAAYMMVDNDRQQFALWKGQPSTDENIVALEASVCDTSTTTSTNSPANAIITPTSDMTPRIGGRGGVPARTIAGGVVGGVAAIIGSLAAFWFLSRPWKRRRGAAGLPVVGAQYSSLNTIATAGYEKPYVSRYHDDRGHRPPLGMPLAPAPPHVLPPFEMAGWSLAPEMQILGCHGKSLGGIYELPATPKKANLLCRLSHAMPSGSRYKFLPEVPGDMRTWI